LAVTVDNLHGSIVQDKTLHLPVTAVLAAARRPWIPDMPRKPYEQADQKRVSAIDNGMIYRWNSAVAG
jgi:hypothetical protein